MPNGTSLRAFRPEPFARRKEAIRLGIMETVKNDVKNFVKNDVKNGVVSRVLTLFFT